MLEPSYPDFGQRHPELSLNDGRLGAPGRGAFGIPLGDVRTLIPALIQAFTVFGGPKFRGFVDEGRGRDNIPF